ncbi:hypothetical protein CTI12_AA376940 [Artemisia annua]|uniref:Uncharacterized protein n=1 Tax=Artemisia annua TaxID=35608 RepID=A0A2U1MI49_ARTAN|nr:hypothetical protein CTI12_AA376940 [Artemisia annua]
MCNRIHHINPQNHFIYLTHKELFIFMNRNIEYSIRVVIGLRCQAKLQAKPGEAVLHKERIHSSEIVGVWLKDTWKKYDIDDDMESGYGG